MLSLILLTHFIKCCKKSSSRYNTRTPRTLRPWFYFTTLIFLTSTSIFIIDNPVSTPVSKSNWLWHRTVLWSVTFFFEVGGVTHNERWLALCGLERVMWVWAVCLLKSKVILLSPSSLKHTTLLLTRVPSVTQKIILCQPFFDFIIYNINRPCTAQSMAALPIPPMFSLYFFILEFLWSRA